MNWRCNRKDIGRSGVETPSTVIHSPKSEPKSRGNSMIGYYQNKRTVQKLWLLFSSKNLCPKYVKESGYLYWFHAIDTPFRVRGMSGSMDGLGEEQASSFTLWEYSDQQRRTPNRRRWPRKWHISKCKLARDEGDAWRSITFSITQAD